MNATGSSTTYTFDAYTSGSLHHAIVSGLRPNTTYYYRVGDPSAMLWSDVYSFVSHPGVGPNVTHTFGVVGDLGQTIYSNGTIQHMLANPAIQSIIHPGACTSKHAGNVVSSSPMEYGKFSPLILHRRRPVVR